MAARAGPSALVRWLAKASRTIIAITRFLESVASFLRQLVQVVGWVVLLISTVGLLVHPHLSPDHLVAPGGGALAILQSLIGSRHRKADENKSLAGQSPEGDDVPSSLDTPSRTEAQALPKQTTSL
jgi:hypothetical protein